MSKKERILRRGMFFLALGLIILLLLGSVSKPKQAVQYISYTIEPGDTLWSISKEYAPKNSDIRNYIYLVTEQNQIGANLQVGQVIEIPCYE